VLLGQVAVPGVSFFNLMQASLQGTWSPESLSSSNGSEALPKAAFLGNHNIQRVYACGRFERIAELTSLYPEVVSQEEFNAHLSGLSQVEVVFSTWGMPILAPEQVEAMSRLRAVFYAAGSTRHFALPFLERGVAVVSAWRANAVAVAEFTMSQVLLSLKNYFQDSQSYTSPKDRWKLGDNCPGAFGETIAILGAGATGSQLIAFLKPFDVKVVVFDPFLGAERAAKLGVRRVSLKQAFAQGHVVSNHLADVPETRGLLCGELFERMRPNATFINTGRGATVDEAELIEVFTRRTDLTALLDVTQPEPPVEGSPLYTLPNVRLSRHLAGSLGNEILRMADCCIEEFIAFSEGRSLRHSISFEAFATHA
jgi:phosphoglycerate dehydrogenase-like enzyme